MSKDIADRSLHQVTPTGTRVISPIEKKSPFGLAIEIQMDVGGTPDHWETRKKHRLTPELEPRSREHHGPERTMTSVQI